MAHEMQTFEHIVCERDVSLQTVMVDGLPWFRGNDVAHALDYGNPRQAIGRHVEEGDRAYLKDLGRPSDGRPLKHNESTRASISASAPAPTNVDQGLSPVVAIFGYPNQ